MSVMTALSLVKHKKNTEDKKKYIIKIQLPEDHLTARNQVATLTDIRFLILHSMER